MPVIALAASGHAETLWTHEDTKDIEYFTVTSAGHLFVTTGERGLLLDRQSGRALWTTTDLRDCEPLLIPDRFHFRCEYRDTDLNFIPASAKRMVGHHPKDGRLAAFDLESGKVLFDSEDAGIGKVREFAFWAATDRVALYGERKDGTRFGAIVSLASGRIEVQGDTLLREDVVFLGVAQNGVALTYGKTRDGKPAISAANLSEGRMAWEKAGLSRAELESYNRKVSMPGVTYSVKTYRFQPPAAAAEGAVILYMSKDGPFRVDASGQQTWKASKLAGSDPSQMQVYEGVLYVLREDLVSALDANDGRVLWQQKPRIDARFMAPTPAGVLLWAENKVDLLARETGKPAWQASAPVEGLDRWAETLDPKRPPEAGAPAPFLTSASEVFVATRDALVAIKLADGSQRQVVSYEFGDKESPESLARDGDAFQIDATQNTARVSGDGRLVYSKHYGAPGLSGWAKLGATVAVAAFTPGYAIPGTMSDVFGERNTATTLGAQYAYYYFEPEGSDDESRRFGFVRVERSTGSERGTLWLNARRPKLALDPASSTVFVQDSDKTIQALAFEAR